MNMENGLLPLWFHEETRIYTYYLLTSLYREYGMVLYMYFSGSIKIKKNSA